jgi:hypothetical protein
MEYNVSEPIIREKHSYLRFLLVILFVAIVMSPALYIYIYYQNKPILGEVAPAQEKPAGEFPGSYGLADDSAVDTKASVSGTLYLSSVRTMASDTAPLPKIYTYSLNDKKLTPISSRAQFDWHMFSPTTAAVLAKTTSSDDTTWQPFSYDLKTGALTGLQNVQGSNVDNLDTSLDNGSYAYSFQTKEQAVSDGGSFDNWNIAIHVKNGEVTKIVKAREPKWLPGGTELLYVGEGGVYRYDVVSKATTLVFAKYAPLVADDIAVSPDGKKVILTRPLSGSLSVLSFGETGELVEIGRIMPVGSFYLRPVFSSDGNYYAVTATNVSKVTNNKGVSNYPINNAVEIRSVTNGAVLQSLPLPDDSLVPLLINSWLPSATL